MKYQYKNDPNITRYGTAQYPAQPVLFEKNGNWYINGNFWLLELMMLAVVLVIMLPIIFTKDAVKSIT